LRQRTVLEDALDDASAEYRKSAVSHGFADCRRNHRPNRILRLWVFVGRGLGVLQQSYQEIAFLRAENSLIPH
jgi:hypothetical protein